MKKVTFALSIISVLLIVFFCVSFFYGGIITGLDYFEIKSTRNVSSEINLNNSLHKIIVILVIPLVEELFYRLGLKFSVRNTSFLILGVLYSIYIFIQPKDIDFNNPKVILVFFGTMILVLFATILIVKLLANKIQLIYSNYSKYIFWLSVLSFSYSHFTLHENYFLLSNILLSPLILFPYIVAGTLYGVIRIKYGFFWCCFVHILWNLLFFLNL